MRSVKLKRKFLLLSSAATFSVACAAHPAHAFDYQTDSGVDIRLDNTIQYSVTERVAPENSYLAGHSNQNPAGTNTINANDGDNNLRSGIVSNRLDLQSKFDISYQGFGFDASVDSFYDTVYNQKTQQSGAGTSPNSSTEPADKFTSQTRTEAGRNIELRNLFVYGQSSIGNVPVTLRVGRFVNLFGESLLFAANGISYGQAPIDIARASSVPNTQAKDVFLPVGQALITVQPTDSISVSAYYQFEWERFNFIPVGSYFSINDFVGPGSQKLLGAVGAPVAFYHGQDQTGKSTGQFGAAFHYDPPASNWDFGVYALQYNDSEPQVVVLPSGIPARPNFSIGKYQLEYADGIQIYGLSTSTTAGPLNLAGEVSIRRHEDLFSKAAGTTANNNGSNPAYATGNTLHYQASFIYAGPKTAAWDAVSAIGEVAGVNLLGFDKNRDNFFYNVASSGVRGGHMALGLRTIVTFTYYEVLPGLDVNPNIGLGWNFMGRAPDTPAFNNTAIDRGGDLTLGVSFSYLNKWTGGISYTNYISPPGRDPYADRDFLALNVERTF